jgi:hypothetical protein
VSHPYEHYICVERRIHALSPAAPLHENAAPVFGLDL